MGKRWKQWQILFSWTPKSQQSFPGGSDGKESACNEGDLGSIPESGRSPEEGHGNWLQYSCLENPINRGASGLQSMGLQRAGHKWATHTKSLQMVTATMKLKGAPWKKSYDKPREHIKKQRITLPTMLSIVKAMVFPVVMYTCESWTIKKAV